MMTRPLPPAILLLSIASLAVGLVSFVSSMINLAYKSLYMTPIAFLFTLIYHITLFVLSKRRTGPPPIPRVANAIENNSRTSVYRPASPTSTSFLHRNAPTMSEQHTAGRSDLYPSYLVSVANCIIVCLLAVFWMSFEWLPFFVTYLSDIKETTGHIAAGYIEGATGYIVSGILWAIFGICVHHRKAQMSKKDFIRMEG